MRAGTNELPLETGTNMTTSKTTSEEAARGQLTPEDQQMAHDAGKQLRRLLKAGALVSMELFFREEGEEKVEVVALPPSVLRLLDAILEAHAGGHEVTIMLSHDEFTLNQAADVLGVSRPFLIKLLDEGKIPSRRVGAHRRVGVDALNRYQRQEEEHQLDILARLQAQAQDLSMGY